MFASMEAILYPLVSKFNAYLSSYILVFLLIAVGLWYSVKTNFVQIRCFGEGMKKVFGNLTHLLSTPDFVAYKFADRKCSPLPWVCRNLWHCQGVAWTLRTLEEYDTAVKEGWIPIFEGFEPGVKRLEG